MTMVKELKYHVLVGVVVVVVTVQHEEPGSWLAQIFDRFLSASSYDYDMSRLRSINLARKLFAIFVCESFQVQLLYESIYIYTDIYIYLYIHMLKEHAEGQYIIVRIGIDMCNHARLI